MFSKGVVKNLKVLIVDADHSDAVAIKSLLQSEFYDYKITVDFSFAYMEAIYNLVNNSYDFCIVNHQLGEMQGLELVESIRERGLNIPIVFLAKDLDKTSFDEIKHAGADLICAKTNFESKKLDAIITQSLNAKPSAAETKQSKFIYENSSSNLASIICELDSRGKILFINQGSYKITAYQASEMIGKKWNEVFAKNANSELQKFLRPNEKLIRTKKGQFKVLEIRKRKIYNDSGNLERIIISAADVTHKIIMRKKKFQIDYSILP